MFILICTYTYIGTGFFIRYKDTDLVEELMTDRTSDSPYVYTHDFRGSLAKPSSSSHIQLFSECIKPDSFIFSINGFQAVEDKPISAGSEIIVLEKITKGLQRDDFTTWLETKSLVDRMSMNYLGGDDFKHKLESALRALLKLNDTHARELFFGLNGSQDLFSSSSLTFINHGMLNELSADNLGIGEFDGIYCRKNVNNKTDPVLGSFWCEKQVDYIHNEELMCTTRESIRRMDKSCELRKFTEEAERKETKKRKRDAEELEDCTRKMALATAELEALKSKKKEAVERKKKKTRGTKHNPIYIE